MPEAFFDCLKQGCGVGGGVYELPALDSPDWPVCHVCQEPLHLSEPVTPDREAIRDEARYVSEMYGREGLEMLSEIVATLLAEPDS
jgi:hypothetical protein